MIRAVIFDLDGVVYCGNQPVPGATELINNLQARNIETIFCTNNSGKSQGDIFAKLASLGVRTTPRHVYSSGACAGQFLKEKNIQTVYPMGSDSLTKELEQSGLSISAYAPDAILVGLNTSFSFPMLANAMQAYFSSPKCLIFACNLDSNYPTDSGLQPGCGPATAALLSATEATLAGIVGKPEPYMLELILKDFGISNNEVLVVGDTYSSDIEMAKRAKCKAVWFTATENCPYEPGVVAVPALNAITDLTTNSFWENFSRKPFQNDRK
ncbi:MAG: HAD-IIA family hydrolase [Nitrospira sp.]|nr:HAD-IIA family hydrolase [Nitrospira sp.]